MNKLEGIQAELTQGFAIPPYEKYAENLEWVKYVALYKLGVEVLDCLELIHNTDTTKPGSVISPAKCYDGAVVRNHTLFSWYMQDFLERRQLATTWLKVLEKNLDPTCLEKQKQEADFKQLNNFLKLVFQHYFKKVQKSEFDLIQLLTECNAYNHISTVLDAKNATNLLGERRIIDSILAVKPLWHFTHKSRNEFMESITDIELLNHAEFRYRKACIKAANDVREIDMKKKLDKVSADIERYKKLLDREKVRNKTLVDLYKRQIVELKSGIKRMSNKYDDKMEDQETKSNLLKMFIERDRNMMQYYKEQLEFFRTEKANMAYRVEVRERRKAEDAQRALEEKLRKSLRKKKPLKENKKKRKF